MTSKKLVPVITRPTKVAKACVVWLEIKMAREGNGEEIFNLEAWKGDKFIEFQGGKS